MNYDDLKEKEARYVKKIIKIAVCAALVLIILATFISGITTIHEGQMGIKSRFGKVVDTNMTAGLHFSVPFIESVKKIDITQQEYLIDLTAYTKDTQTVDHMIIKVNYAYDTSKLDYIIRNVGIKNIESKIVAPQVLSNTKNIVGQYKAEELIAKRAECQERIEDAIAKSFGDNGLLVAAVNIEEITFKAEFEAIVEQKVAAEQQALTVKNETAKKEELAKQKVIEAQAEADAIKVKADAEAYSIQVIQEQIKKSPEYIELQKVEKWNGEFPQVMGNTVNPFVTME